MISDEKITALYSSLMGETKARIDAIGAAVKQLRENPEQLNRFLQLEFCYLQIRMVCEAVALGAVFVHEPLGLTGDIRKAYNAGKIFELLTKVNPRCFPIPVKVQSAAGVKQVSLESSRLTKERLTKIYRACGEALHRGSFNRILKDSSLRHDIDLVDDFYKEIILLLRGHGVFVASTGKFLFAGITPTQISVQLVNVTKNL